MKPERLGSYSTVLTVKGTSYLSYEKSTARKRRLWPPPLCRVVIRPRLLRPDPRLKPLVKDFSGALVVRTLRKSIPDMWRRESVVGLYFFIYSEFIELYQFNFIAGFEIDVCFFASTLNPPFTSDKNSLGRNSGNTHLFRLYSISVADGGANRLFSSAGCYFEDIDIEFVSSKSGLLGNTRAK